MYTPPLPVFLFLQESTTENQGFWDTIVHSNFLNFLIAAIILIWIFKRFKLLSILDQRQATVIKELQDAEDKRAKAIADLEEIEKRTAQLTVEVESVLKDAQQTAEMVASTIVTNAEEEARKIVSNAKKRIEQEQKTAARELEERLMREAVYAARQLLENTLSDDDKHRSVEEFVATLPELYEKELQS